MRPADNTPEHGQHQPVVGVVGCDAGGVNNLREHLVMPLLDHGYRVTVSLTPTAERCWNLTSETAEM